MDQFECLVQKHAWLQHKHLAVDVTPIEKIDEHIDSTMPQI